MKVIKLALLVAFIATRAQISSAQNTEDDSTEPDVYKYDIVYEFSFHDNIFLDEIQKLLRKTQSEHPQYHWDTHKWIKLFFTEIVEPDSSEKVMESMDDLRNMLLGKPISKDIHIQLSLSPIPHYDCGIIRYKDINILLGYSGVAALIDYFPFKERDLRYKIKDELIWDKNTIYMEMIYKKDGTIEILPTIVAKGFYHCYEGTSFNFIHDLIS